LRKFQASKQQAPGKRQTSSSIGFMLNLVRTRDLALLRKFVLGFGSFLIGALPVGGELGISFRVMKRLYCFSLALLLTGLMGGCKQGAALPEPPRVANCEPGRAGGRLVLGALGNPRTFNPLLDFDSGSDAVIRLLFSSLVTLNLESQEPEPGLAESWSVAQDQRTWTFKLRKNLHWSDGEPLTANDVVFTWNELMLNPKHNQVSY